MTTFKSDTDVSVIIAKVMSFDMQDVLERYAQRQDLPEEVAREHEIEFKRFLALKAINPEKTYGMKGDIDELWHTFILFTQNYFNFCFLVYGHYLHHSPRVKRDHEIPSEGKNSYQEFLDDYEVVYGKPAPAYIWPRLRLRSSEASVAREDAAECSMCDSCEMCE